MIRDSQLFSDYLTLPKVNQTGLTSFYTNNLQ